MCQADSAHLERLLATLARWDTHVCSSSKPLRDQWVRILNEQDWALALVESEHGKQLRQASPMAVILPTSVRLGIIREVRQLKNSQHVQA